MKLTRENLQETLNRLRIAYGNVPQAQMDRRYEAIRKLVMLLAVVGTLFVYGRSLAKDAGVQGMKKVAVGAMAVGKTETPALAGASAAGATVLVLDSPGIDLEAAESEMVGRARHSIDVAMDDFSDVGLAEALVARRVAGVDVRVYLSRSERGAGVADRSAVLRVLRAGSVDVRVAQRPGRGGLGSYAFDGVLLRTGGTGWVAERLKGQDANGEVVFIESRAAVEHFESKFEDLWSAVEGEGKP